MQPFGNYLFSARHLNIEGRQGVGEEFEHFAPLDADDGLGLPLNQQLRLASALVPHRVQLLAFEEVEPDAGEVPRPRQEAGAK